MRFVLEETETDRTASEFGPFLYRAVTWGIWKIRTSPAPLRFGELHTRSPSAPNGQNASWKLGSTLARCGPPQCHVSRRSSINTLLRSEHEHFSGKGLGQTEWPSSTLLNDDVCMQCNRPLHATGNGNWRPTNAPSKHMRNQVLRIALSTLETIPVTRPDKTWV